MEKKFCQSCGMPMGSTDELYGTERDGTKSGDYCKYCYGGGAFTADCGMEEMMEFCVKPMVEHSPGILRRLDLRGLHPATEARRISHELQLGLLLIAVARKPHPRRGCPHDVVEIV